MFPKEKGALAVSTQDSPDRIKLNAKSIEPSPPAQAKIELIREDIVSTIGPMIATLEAALAMAAIPNDAGLKYSLVRAGLLALDCWQRRGTGRGRCGTAVYPPARGGRS